MGANAQYQASLERVLTRLEEVTGREARFEGGQYKTLCPAHPDRNPSLTVRWDDGKTYLHCHAGCTGSRPHVDPAPVLNALGLSTADLFDEQKQDSQWRGVTNLTEQRRRRRQQDKPAKYEVTGDLEPRTEVKQAKGDPAGVPYVEAWHLYQHPDTLEVDWAAIRIVQPHSDGGYDKSFFYAHRDDRVRGKRIYLGEHPETGKKLFETLPDGWASKMPSEHRLQTLFHLGQLRADTADGRTIYVVEGESDANAGRFAGLAATSAPKGAGKWQPHHSSELAGADVVVVADCDDEGIQGAEVVARSLVAVASSVRIVQARSGKDLRDHLAAGHGIDDLVEVDLGIAELNPDRAAAAAARNSTPDHGADTGLPDEEVDTYADAPGPNIIDDQRTPNERPTYLIRNGEIVERTWRTEGGRDNPVYRARYKSVLGCAAWVTEVTEEDDGEEDARYVARTRDQVWHLERHGTDGTVVDQVDLRFPLEQIESGEWLAHWPWPDTILGHRRSDRDRTKTAILQARTAPSRRTRVYTSPGWRNTETGPIYIHGAGAISRGGHLDVDVDLGPVLTRTALPEPSTDPAQLRAAFFHGTEPLRQLPSRIQAPLRGLVFASLVEPIEMVTHLEGPKGTKKTALARQMLQHIAPGMRFSRGVKEMVSGASDISTTKGMSRILGKAKDMLVLVDDMAPDRGGAAEARVRLAELARKMYNRSAGTKANRHPGEIVNELPPRCSLLTTGEIVADGSAGSRCLNLHVGPGVVTDEAITDLEMGARVDARGIIGASYLQWVAERRDDLLAWREQLREIYLTAWRSSLGHLPYPSDVLSRVSEACRDYTVGEIMFLTFLRDRDALSEEEVAEQWHWSINGILEAATAMDAETSDVGTNLVWTIKDLLATGRAHLTDRHGSAPVVDGDLNAAQRYGYTAQQRPGGSGTAEVAPLWRENGARIGAVVGDRVFLNPAEVEYQARQHRQRAERPWTETTSSLATALDAHGWLATRTNPDTGRLNRQVGRNVYGRTQRVWDIPRWLLDGFDDDGGTGGGPVPVDPRLTQIPGWLELPVEQEHDTSQQQLPAAVGNEQPATSTETASVKPALQPVTSTHEVAATPAPARQEASERQASPATAAASSAPTPLRESGPMTPDEEWNYRLIVVDIDAIYLPEQDGTIVPLPQPNPPTAADIAAFGEAFGLRHGRNGIGHIHLSPRLSDHLGLVVDDDLTAKVHELGLQQRDDLKDWRSKRNVAAVEQLAERGAEVVSQLQQAGWEANRLGPRFTIRHPDPEAPQDPSRTRAFTVVLEAYSYMWEPDERDPSGPDQKDWPLPDPDDEPAAYCRQLALRLSAAAELLGVPWQASAAGTGAELLDRLDVRMKKDPATGQRDQDWRRYGREAVPEKALHASRVGGQHMWEPHNQWSRRPSEDELDAARELVLFDERYSYLPRARSLSFGYDEPQQMDPATVAARLANGDQLYGLVLLRLPVWDVAAMPPPHPDMPTAAAADGHTVRRWTSMRTPWLLANLHKHTEYQGDELAELIEEAWVWPKTHRMFNGWADRVRTARARAEQEAAAAAGQDAVSAAADWHAVEQMVKGVYAGYLGKLGSRRVLRKGSERYHHHYRPLAQATVWGEQRIQAFIKLAKYAQASGVFPLFAAGTDSYGYLDPTVSGDAPQPDTDDGKAGKLRVKRRLTLTDHMRQRLLDGADGYKVFDDEMMRLDRGEQA